VKKYKKVQKAYAEKGAVALYHEYVVGGESYWNLLKYELFINFTAGIPGALGFLIRKILFPRMISQFGKGLSGARTWFSDTLKRSIFKTIVYLTTVVSWMPKVRTIREFLSAAPACSDARLSWQTKKPWGL
jgi:hypothetical protein